MKVGLKINRSFTLYKEYYRVIIKIYEKERKTSY
jgi:hypothetical protein